MTNKNKNKNNKTCKLKKGGYDWKKHSLRKSRAVRKSRTTGQSRVVRQSRAAKKRVGMKNIKKNLIIIQE